MKAVQGIWKAAFGLLMPLTMAVAQTTPPVTPPPVTPPPPPPPPAAAPAGVIPTPQELAPKPERRRDADVPRPAPPRELGKPSDDLRIDIEAFSVADDAPPELRASLAKLTAPFTGKARSFEDLANAAAEVTRFLQSELGYYLGYAYIPEQQTTGGVVRIAVLEGRLDEVRLNWTEGLPVRREVVQAYLDELVPGSILKVRDVERTVFLINDLRGITAQVEVQAGSKPGTATLVVTPRADATWTARADLDTNGSRYLGRFRLTGLATMNSPFGRGDGLTGNVLASTTGGLFFGLVNYTTPVGSSGLKLGASVSAVHYKIDKTALPLDLSGDAVTLSGFGLYPIVRSRNLNFFSLLSVEHKQFTDKAADFPTKKSSDTLAVGGNGDFRDSLASGGVNTYEFTAIAGRLKFKVERADQAPSNFSKATAGFTRLQNILTNRLLAYVAVRGQAAFQNLDNTEQFRLGGPDGVRAFAPGEGTGDSGVIGSLELRFLPPESIFGRIGRESVVSLFYDIGRIKYYKDPTASYLQLPEDHVNTATLGGAGVAATWVRPGEFALRLSVASRTQGEPKSDTKGGSTRAYAQLTYFIK